MAGSAPFALLALGAVLGPGCGHETFELLVTQGSELGSSGAPGSFDGRGGDVVDALPGGWEQAPEGGLGARDSDVGGWEPQGFGGGSAGNIVVGEPDGSGGLPVGPIPPFSGGAAGGPPGPGWPEGFVSCGNTLCDLDHEVCDLMTSRCSQKCVGDQGCGYPTPYCMGWCVECRSPEDCLRANNGRRFCERGACVECKSPADCANVPYRPYCDVYYTFQCRSCLSDEHCPGGFCDLMTGSCR